MSLSNCPPLTNLSHNNAESLAAYVYRYTAADWTDAVILLRCHGNCLVSRAKCSPSRPEGN